MSKTAVNFANLPADVQAILAAQAAELARKDPELLGLSLCAMPEHNSASRMRWSPSVAKTAVRMAHRLLPSAQG
tara:strand:- start:251 stop:472 length:222 start_codon:yes stop_codon:yes gene_type:complete